MCSFFMENNRGLKSQKIVCLLVAKKILLYKSREQDEKYASRQLFPGY